MRARMMALVGALIATSAAWGDDLQDAINAAQRGDHAAAFPVFLRLAEAGDPAYQSLVGSAYSEGMGVPQNYQEAVRWMRRAAEQGYAVAQFNLGSMYSRGEGTLQDYREAVRWYRKATTQGDVDAMTNLGAIYFNGEGVPKDLIRAHMWSNLAAAAGDTHKGVSNRDLAASKMTPAQIAEAQRLARECLASDYKRCGEPD